MTPKINLGKNYLVVLFLLFLAFSPNLQAQEEPFSPRLNDNGNSYITIKGDYTFLSNSVMNRRDSDQNQPSNVNVPYNGNLANNSVHVEYVDIDSDPTTFSSSSSTLTLPSCSRIFYAGLYWAGNYDEDVKDSAYETSSQDPLPNDSNRYDFTSVKLRLPVGGYIDLQADTAADPVGQEDDIIIDGHTTPIYVRNSPYVCYKNVTGELQALADPNGEYTVANVRGTRGHTTYGAAGWTLVVIYENPSLPGRYISTFDGYEGVTTSSWADRRATIPIVGFNTVPVGPVNARIGASVLEGEFHLSGDRFQIRSEINRQNGQGYTNLFNPANPTNNFFNSNITIDGANVTTRNINGTNSMGYDSDIFDIQNPSESVIPNGETQANLRLTTNSDWFGAFLVTFGVEIIEPKIVLEKKVNPLGSTLDITGQGVNLGDDLVYVLTFENTGNDDATNYTIRDVLPINVSPPSGPGTNFNPSDLDLPPGVTYTYDSATRTIVFTIPDNLVKENDPPASIRMRVKVAQDCFDFIDACTDRIENLAYSTYQGVDNPTVITDDPSVNDFNACGFVTPGASNFLLDDLSACNFTRTVQLCGDDVLLDAGDGFPAYDWYLDVNNDGLLDAGDTLLNSGGPNNDTLLVTQEGTYIVDKADPDPCKAFKEIFVVERFGSNTVNPIIEYFNSVNSDADVTNDIEGEIVNCSIDNDELPKIFLCGANDEQLLQSNITDAQTISWELLDESSCTATGDDCANKNLGCTWNQVATGGSYLVNSAGKYRLVVTYQNGCFNRFYFNVFQNIFDIQYENRDIICATNGYINITNPVANYGYQLIDITNNTILVPYGTNPNFSITANGVYRVDAVQLDGSGNPVPNGCVFSTPEIGILDRDFQVDVDTTPEVCNAQGTIEIDVLNVEPNYTYILRRQSDGVLIDDETAQPSNTHTFNVNAGDYTIEVSTEDGCFYTEDVSIARTPDPTLSANVTANIGCSAGSIDLTANNGLPGYSYAIWSKDGIILHSPGGTPTDQEIVDNIPGSAYQGSTFTFGWRDTDGDGFDEYFPGEDGAYVFVVVDANNCFALSAPVTINDNGAMTLAPTNTPISCNGSSTASLTIGTSGGVGPFMYSIDDGASYQPTDTFVGLSAGTYDLRVTDSSGCDVQQSYTISEPDALTAEALLTENYTCSQLGEITIGSVTPTDGGSNSYQYSLGGGTWTPATPGGFVFTNLTDGTYTVMVRDASFTSCILTLPDITIDPLPLAPSPSYSVAYNCDGTGNITILPNDPTYTYSLNSGAPQGPNVFNNVAVGSHTITIDYGSNCTIDVPVVVQVDQAFEANAISATSTSCNGLSDGTITFEVLNFDATAGFDYSVDGGSNYINSTTSPVTTAAVFNAGSQTILIRKADDTSCSTSISENITEPTSVVASASITTALSCTTGATITASASGGTPNYVYQLEYDAGGVVGAYDFATNGTNTVFSGIADGDYIVRVRDANNCEDPIDTALTIAPLNPVVFDVTPTNCYSGAADGSIVVNVTNGNGGYQFRRDGGPWLTPSPANSTTYTFDNLTNGSYDIEVRDALGCPLTLPPPQTAIINAPLTVSATAPNITACTTSTDVTITATGGDGNYTYAVIPSTNTIQDTDFGVANPFSVGAANTYTVYVRDNNGGTDYCQAIFSINILQDPPLVITPTPTDVSCFGGADGSISIMVDSGGETPFRYSIDDGVTYHLGNTFPNLVAGTYPVKVIDANNCETPTTNVTIDQPTELMADTVQTANYTCTQDGEITVGGVTLSGGSGDYQFSLNSGAWTASTATSHTFTGLIDGTHSIRVRDANVISCIVTLADVIIHPLPTEPVVTTSVVYNCDGTGNITVLPNDPTYTYSINSGTPQTTNIFNNIAVGNHTITVDYGGNCTVDVPVAVSAGNAFEASILTFSDLNCNADNSGSITIAADNFGAGGFEYSLDGTTFTGAFTTSPQVISGLSAQAYTITVRDVDNPISGCTIVLNQTLTEPAPVVTSASITDPFMCSNSGATITASATGGTPTYMYQLEFAIGGIVTAYQSETTFTNVPAGSYIVRARDINLCADPIDSPITVIAPASPTFTATPTSCYSGANDASIIVDVTSLPGNGGFQFSRDGGPWMTPTPVTATTYTFTGLSSGSYDIQVRDAFGCPLPLPAPQTVVINPQLTANAVLDQDLTCLVDASVTVNANGGSGTFSYEWGTTATGPWNSTGFTTNVFSTNTDGTYFFRVVDTTAPTACEVITNAVVVTPAVLPSITSVAPTDLTCNGDNSGALSIVYDTSQGLAPFVINVDNTSTSTNYGTQTSGLPAGNYAITLTDAKGCVDTETAVITEPAIINYTASSVPITCDAVGMNTNPGSITITGTTGGTPEYTYILSANNGIPTQTYTTTSGARDHTFNILNFGIYQIDIVDANGCASYSTEIIASPPNDLDIDVSTATTNCATGGTAIVTVGAAVGSGLYDFAILETYTAPYSSTYVGPDPLPVGNTDTATFTGLTPGVTYTFVVYDRNTNCYYFETADAPIDSPSNMTSTLDVIANVSCTGAADGNISFTFDNYDIGATQIDYEIFNSQSNITTGETGSSLVNPPTGAISITNFATLPPGEYYLLLSEVSGAFAGCSVFGGEFSIRESVNLLDVSLAITENDNCNVNAGVITATGQFGTAPYEYQFLPNGSTAPTIATWAGSSANVFNGEGGTYDVYIKDAHDCIQVDTIVLPTDPSPEISLAIVDECVPEGTYEVVVTLDVAGMAPYALSINGEPFQNATFNGSNQFTISSLSTGAAQTVQIQDLNGCGEVENFTIQPPLEFNATLTTLLDCEIAPANNAEITIDVSAGSGSYDYEISGPVNEARTTLPSDPFIWNLASLPGTYRVTIYDTSTAIPNCSRFVDVVVPAAVSPVLSVDAFTDVSCNGADDGTITVSVPDNGIGPYLFEITHVDGVLLGTAISATTSTSTSATFQGLSGAASPGTNYTIRVTGSNSCFDEEIQAIQEPALIDVPLPAITVVEFACTNGNNQDNASIAVNPTGVSGGSGNYVRYVFINTATSTTVQDGSNNVYTETNTAGGNYDIFVYDDMGCSNPVAANVTIAPFDELLTVSTSYTVSCNPISDGEVTIAVTSTLNDATRFEYSIDNGGTWQTELSHAGNQHIFSGLTLGIHNFLVRHADTGCILPVSETIADPNTFEIAILNSTDVICHGTATGTVTFDVTDPIGGYAGTYSWSIFNTNGTPSNPADDGPAVDFGTSASYASNNLAAGEYRISVTQDNAPTCANEIFFNIAGPSEPLSGNRNVTEITCNPTNNGLVEIIDAQGGWGDYRYLVFDTTTAPAPDTNDRSIYLNNPRFENLVAGNYQVWLIDANSCPLQLADVVLANPIPIVADLQINQQNCTDFTGEIEVINEANGQGSNYSYQLQRFDGSTFVDIRPIQTTDVFSDLGAGQYQVIVSDQWGCSAITNNTIELYEPIVPLATVVKTIDCSSDPGGRITITQTGGSGAFDYEVRYPGTLTTDPADDTNTTGVFAALATVGDYTFTVIDQAAGNCSTTITQNLQDSVYPVLTIDAFTDVNCNGANDGTISVSVIDNGVSPYDFRITHVDGVLLGTALTPSSNTATTATFTGLAGTSGVGYTISATGSNSCSVTQDVPIAEPALLTVAAPTPVQFQCTTGNTTDYPVIAITTVSGGSNTYVRYQFVNDANPGMPLQDGPDNTYTETNFAGGNYTITVWDDNGCSATTTTSIAPFDLLLPATITVDRSITCPNLSEDITINAFGSLTDSSTPAGLANYEFRQLPSGAFQASNQFVNLPIGVHNFEVRNSNTGCVVTVTHSVIDPDVIESTIDKVSDDWCLNGGGSFNITAINNYTGTFDYQVYDLSGTPLVGAGFNGSSDTTSLPLPINGLGGGGYFVRITETDPTSAFCFDDSNAITIITPSSAITYTPSEEASPSCSNDQGVILIDPEGGNGPYDIMVVNTTTGQPPYIQNGVEAALFTGLSAGDFDITVTDARSCVAPSTITLVRPDDFVPTISTTPLVCFNGNTATVFTTVPSGRNVDATATYEYQLNSYDDLIGTNLLQTSVAQGSITFTGISAGFYSITVTDNFGCSFTSPIEEVVNPSEVQAQLIRTSPVTCQSDMQMELTVSGGLSGNYEYRRVGDVTWIPMGVGVSTVPIPPTGDLPPDTYRYEVRDADNACAFVTSNEIEEDVIIPLDFENITSSNVGCYGESTGRISAEAEFGMGGYMYELYYNPVGGQPFSSASIQVTSQASGDFSGLSVGFYFVRVTSGVDCILVSEEIEITEPVLLEVVDPNNFTDVSCFGADNGTIIVELQGGSGGYQYAISPNLNQFFDDGVFEDLEPGDYTVIAQDQNGCNLILDYTIVEPEILSATAVPTPEVCAGEENGIIDLTFIGGTPPYSTRLSTEASFVQGRDRITGLAAGGYIIFVEDANGCEYDLGVTIEPGVNLNATVEPIYECNGDTPDNYVNITLEDPTVIGDVLYAIDNEPAQLNPDFRNSSPGTHTISILHANGCIETIDFEIEDFEPLTLTLEQGRLNEIIATAEGGREDYTFYFDDINNGTDNTYIINRTDTYVVRVIDENGCEVTATIEMEFIDIEIPNFFTPDGDGLNDLWMPRNQEAFPEILTIIFDRYGREVYRLGLNDAGWDGLYKESELPTGDYWYVIKLRGENDDREFVGHFTLYR